MSDLTQQLDDWRRNREDFALARESGGYGAIMSKQFPAFDELSDTQGELHDQYEAMRRRAAELEAENGRLRRDNARLSGDVSALEVIEQARHVQVKRAEAALRETRTSIENILEEVALTEWCTLDEAPPPDIRAMCQRLRAILTKCQKESGNG